MDELDWLLLQALALAPREPNAALARVLNVSEQTIARRYRRLSARGVRIYGTADIAALGIQPWTVRLHAAPSSVYDLATALAKRPDTAWVYLASGGTEIIFNALLPTHAPSSTLLAKLPRTTTVRKFTAHLLLDSPLQPGAATLDKVAPYRLTGGQANRLTTSPLSWHERVELDPADRSLLDAVAIDGRQSVTALATHVGEPDSTTRARLQRLQSNGLLRFTIDIPTQLLGRAIEARLWLSVAPVSVLSAATRLAAHPATTFVAHTTGPTNLVATIACPTIRDLATFTTESLAQIPGIQTVETAPIHTTIKRFNTEPAFGQAES